MGRTVCPPLWSAIETYPVVYPMGRTVCPPHGSAMETYPVVYPIGRIFCPLDGSAMIIYSVVRPMGVTICPPNLICFLMAQTLCPHNGSAMNTFASSYQCVRLNLVVCSCNLAFGFINLEITKINSIL